MHNVQASVTMPWKPCARNKQFTLNKTLRLTFACFFLHERIFTHKAASIASEDREEYPVKKEKRKMFLFC